MGSSSSTSKNRWHSEFKPQDNNCCGHADSLKVVTRVREMKTYVVGLVTHNAVYLSYRCKNCNSEGNITVQLFREGLDVTFGQFEYNYKCLEEWIPDPVMNVPDAIRISDFAN